MAKNGLLLTDKKSTIFVFFCTRKGKEISFSNRSVLNTNLCYQNIGQIVGHIIVILLQHTIFV